MQPKETYHLPEKGASDLWRARTVVENEGPSQPVMTLMKRDRKEGDDRRMAEFLRIDRGREA